MSKINNKISIIIVTYNSSRTIFKLIHSLNKIDSYIKEIIIIDNNSSDIDKILKIKSNKKIVLIKNNKNKGFAKAVNQGIKISKQNFILLINPDCYLKNDSIIDSIKRIQKNNNIGAIGGKIKKDNSDKYQFTATNSANFFVGLFEFTNLKKIFPKNIFSYHFWVENYYKGNQPIKVTSLCGAFMIIRKKINNKLNLFDEKFFMYLEDIDYGIKINKQNYDVIFNPISELQHIGGASSDSKYNIVLKHWYNSRILLFMKYQTYFTGTILKQLFLLEEKFLKIYHKIKGEPYE